MLFEVKKLLIVFCQILVFHITEEILTEIMLPIINPVTKIGLVT